MSISNSKVFSKYGLEYQLKQANKYRNRDKNHWKIRIALAFDLVNKYAIKNINKKAQETIVVDVGCSIGTFAIEFAKLGFKSFGVDLDDFALEIAKKLSKEEKVSPKFICGNISEWNNFSRSPIDIAICFDIFEHLYDNEIISFLQSIRKNLSKNGYLIFHTFPTQYDYIFYPNEYKMYWPLIPFRNIKTSRFNKLVRIYSLFLDLLYLIRSGKAYNEQIRTSSHCNPLSKSRLRNIFLRSGFKIIYLESSQLYPFKKKIQDTFSKQPISYRNLYGVVKVK